MKTNLSRCLATVAVATFPVSLVRAQQDTQPPCHDLEVLTGIAKDAMNQISGMPGLCLQVEQRGQSRYRRAFGGYTLTQNVPLASATKMITAAVVLTLVDRGLLRLDDRVGQYLPEYDVPPLDAITLRMCLSHTSGMQNASLWTSDPNTTLREAARNIARSPLLFAPGTKFSYGGVSMHVAGAVCEVAAGQSWAELFQDHLAGPLGMTHTDYGATANPRLAGGAHSDLADYGRFLEMLRRDGEWYGGVRVLSAASVAEMVTDHSSHVPIYYSPHPRPVPYGLGVWLDQRDSSGRTTHFSSPGVAGFTGWVDRARGVTGIVLANHDGAALFPYFDRCVAVVDEALLPIGTQCRGAGSPACAADVRLNGTTWPRAGLSDFGFRVDGAPGSAAGLLLLGTPSELALPVLDLRLWVGPTFTASAALATDASGAASVRVPLTAVAAGQSIGVQTLWLDAGGCGAFGLRASHALTVTTEP